MSGAAAAIALVMSLGLLCARRAANALLVCAAQGLFAGAALGAAGSWVAILACALNGIAMPLALRRTLAHPPADHKRRNSGSAVLWLATLTLLVVLAAGLARIGTGDVAALGASATLLGLVPLAQRSPSFSPALWLLSSQNGLVVVASAIPGVPISSQLIIAAPLIPALVLANTRLHR